jgi:hypothetical protein
VGGQWRIATLSRRGKCSPAAGPLKEYYPPGGFKDAKSIIQGIDMIEKTERNKYLSDTEMVRLTDEKVIKMAYWKRIMIFQLILNYIEEAVAIVGVDSQIDKIVSNYEHMMKVSQKALNHLQGASEKAGEPSRLKRPKTVEIPKFDVNKPGMQTFLNSMELLSKSYKFDTDKDLAQFYLNNLTESSKTTIFTIFPLRDKSFYENSAVVIKYLKSFISPNIRINALRDIRVLKMTENGGLYAYYKSFNKLVSELGPNSMNQESLIHYFIAGSNPNAVRNTNLNLHMHIFYTSKPNATITDLYAEADKVISLSGTNSNIIGLGKRAGPDRGTSRPQQMDNDYNQRPYNGLPYAPRFRGNAGVMAFWRGNYGVSTG